MRIAKPWFRAQDETWYVWHNGKQVKLGKNEDRAKYKHRAMLRRGQPLADQTVRQVIAAYWKWVKRNLAESTCARRKIALDSFSAFVPAKLAAEDLKAYHVQRWIDGNDRIKSPTTANTVIGIIKGMMSWAKTMGYVERDPIADMKRPAAITRQEFVPAKQWPKLLALATDEEFRDYMIVMLSAGSRATEMRKFEACHFDGSRLVLPIGLSKGKRKSRVVYLPDDALAIVKRLVEKYPDGPLFRNSDGEAWTNNAIRCRFRRLKRKLKMPWLTATKLRHSFAHHRLTSGQDALTVSKLIGHADTKMLALRYGHLDQNTEYMKNAANRVALPLLPTV